MTATKEQLQALLERVEAATGPDREIDGELDAALRMGTSSLPDWARNNFPRWKHINSGRVCCLHDDGSHGLNWASAEFTASIDSALALVERVLADREIDLHINKPRRDWQAACIRITPLVMLCGECATLPLAILAALLKALIAQSDEVAA